MTADLQNFRIQAKAVVHEFYPSLEDFNGKRLTTSRRQAGANKGPSS